MNQKTYEELIIENQKLKQENAKLKIKVENQELQINWFNRYVFGPKKENISNENENIVDGKQCSIFGEVKDEEFKKEIEEKTEEIVVHKKKNTKKVQAGIKKAELKNVETETVEVVLEDDKKVCPSCESELEHIGKEFVRQEIEYIPAKLRLVRYVRNIYKCKKCGTNKSEKETPTIVKTKTPAPLLSHSFASASLATEVIYQKYYMGVPLYRQEKIWDDRGLILPKNMMANWCIKLSQYYLEPIYNLMLNQLRENSEVLHMDETTIQCNKEPGKSA